jgi:small subunit ribosomal protein S27Ae
VAKARTDLYKVQGETLNRTHKSCPKCGPGIFLAEHEDRRSCGKCGYSESKGPKTPTPPPVPKAKGPKPA